MALNIEDVLARIVAVEQEALAGIQVACDAVPYYFHTQQAFPYFTNRLSSISVDSGPGGDEDFGEEIDLLIYDIILRLTVNHLSAGVVGEYEDRLSVYIPQVIDYFNARELLQSASYPTAPDDLTRARIISSTGLAFFSEGLNVQQIGAEFTLRCEFVNNIDQAYL